MSSAQASMMHAVDAFDGHPLVRLVAIAVACICAIAIAMRLPVAEAD